MDITHEWSFIDAGRVLTYADLEGFASLDNPTITNGITVTKNISAGAQITPVKIGMKTSSYNSDNPSYIGGDGLNVEIGTKGNSASQISGIYKFRPTEMLIPGKLLDSNRHPLTYLGLRTSDFVKMSDEEFADMIIQDERDAGFDPASPREYRKFYAWHRYNFQGEYLRGDAYFIGLFSVTLNGRTKTISISNGWVCTPKNGGGDFLEVWYPFEGDLKGNGIGYYDSTNYHNKCNNLRLHVPNRTNTGYYYLKYTPNNKQSQWSTYQCGSFDAKELANNYHTLVLRDSTNILFTCTAPSIIATPVNSDADLRNLFGGRVLAGSGVYCQLNLQGGTIDTEKLIKADKTAVPLSSISDLSNLDYVVTI